MEESQEFLFAIATDVKTRSSFLCRHAEFFPTIESRSNFLNLTNRFRSKSFSIALTCEFKHFSLKKVIGEVAEFENNFY